MSSWIYFNGVVNLKPGTTPAQVFDLFDRHTGMVKDDPDQLELSLDATSTYDDGNGTELEIESGQFTYLVNGDYPNSYGGEIEDFLKELAETYAAGPWTSYEGEEPDQIEVIHGTDPIANARLAVENRRRDVEVANQRLSNAIHELVMLEGNA